MAYETHGTTCPNEDGSMDIMWRDCEIGSFFDREEGVYTTVYYFYDQGSIYHPAPSHSTRLWIV